MEHDAGRIVEELRVRAQMSPCADTEQGSMIMHAGVLLARERRASESLRDACEELLAALRESRTLQKPVETTIEALHRHAEEVYSDAVRKAVEG